MATWRRLAKKKCSIYAYHFSERAEPSAERKREVKSTKLDPRTRCGLPRRHGTEPRRERKVSRAAWTLGICSVRTGTGRGSTCSHRWHKSAEATPPKRFGAPRTARVLSRERERERRWRYWADCLRRRQVRGCRVPVGMPSAPKTTAN